MELSSKIQEKRQETMNKSYSNGDIDVRNRTTLSCFLADKQQSSNHSSLRFKDPISSPKLLKKRTQERENLGKTRKRFTTKISLFLSNAVSCSKPKTSDENGMQILVSRESSGSSKNREVFGPKPPLSKICKKNHSNEGSTGSGSTSSYHSVEEENVLGEPKSPLQKMSKKNGLGELLNSDSWSSSSDEVEEQVERRNGFPDDFVAGKLCFPIKKMFESVVMDVKGRKKELCKRRILMGDRCRPLDFSGVIHYDENGNPAMEFPFKRTPTQSPLSHHVRYGRALW